MKKFLILLFAIVITCFEIVTVKAVAVGYSFILNNTISSEYGGDKYPGKHIVNYNNGYITVFGDGMGCAIDGTSTVDGACSESLVEFKFYPNSGYEAKITIDGVNGVITNNSYNLKYTEKGKKTINISFVKKEEPKPTPEVTQPETPKKEEPQVTVPKEETIKKEENKKEPITTEENKTKEEKEEIKEEVTETITKLENKEIEFYSETPLNSNYKLEVEEITEEDLENYTLYKTYEINIKNDNEIIKIEKGNYTIKIKIPEELKDKKELLVIYINGSEVEEMETEIKDDYIVFKTTHLSKYAIVEKKLESKEDKKEDKKEEKDNN